MTKYDQVKKKAVELIVASPEGKRWSELIGEISQALPGITTNYIISSLGSFRTELPDNIYQPTRGLYRATAFMGDGEAEAEIRKEAAAAKIKEEDFYEPFRRWLVNELEECTRAIALGGNKFKDKWGTPDVIGVREPRRSDIIKPSTEIVSAEVKLDVAGLITAFGQACSYKLFSHRSYIVVPQASSDEDITRLDALARAFGIGLVLFNSLDPKAPGFSIRARAARGEPDMFYVNKYLKLVEDELFA